MIEVRVPHGMDVRVRRVEARGTVTPSEGQYRVLLLLGGGAALVHGTKRECEPLIRRGWVTYETSDAHGYSRVRLTPDGLRALALAVERYGWPSWLDDAVAA